MSRIFRRLATTCSSYVINSTSKEPISLASVLIRNDPAIGHRRQLHSSRTTFQKHAGDQKLAEDHESHETLKVEQFPNLRPVDRPEFPGSTSEWTSTLEFIGEKSFEGIPVYRVLDRHGEIIDPSQEPQISKETMLKLYRHMNTLVMMDRILYECQRHGRISFYMTNHGEEATQFGSIMALDENDVCFGQYREAGVYLWRGFSIQECMDQCFGNEDAACMGRSMPVHYGSRKHNLLTISSPLSTQMPQAAGYAYALKLKNPDRCVICYFGDGAASEGDAFTGMNMAAVLSCPTIFFCRNNGYAISTPTKEQYRGDGIAARGPGLGIPSVRVDGNDLLAVYNATRAGRQICVDEQRPVLIEAMTYRIGHHSTSDDSSAYRSVDEVRHFDSKDHPIIRLRKYMVNKGWWSDKEEEVLKEEVRREVMTCFNKADSKKKPPIYSLFDDVLKTMPPNLRDQASQLESHLSQYQQHYPISDYVDQKSKSS